jgi:hypothetical protein
MAQVITGGQVPENMLPFAYGRFEQGKAIRPRYESGVLG